MLTPDSIALQLYTMRSETAKDFAATLKRVAEIGYTAVEPAGYGSLTVTEARAALDEHGLIAPAVHIPLATMETRLDGALEDAAILGANYVVVPFLPPDRRGKDDAAGIVTTLNRAGAAARAAGMVLAYHNHAFEYEPLAEGSDETLFDFLLANTDPDLVGIELDVFWSKVGGADPVHELTRLRGRVPLLHLKDYTGGASAESAAPVGAGSLDWPAIVLAANEAGVVWGIVEQDFPNDPYQDITTSLANARQLLSAQA